MSRATILMLLAGVLAGCSGKSSSEIDDSPVPPHAQQAAKAAPDTKSGGGQQAGAAQAPPQQRAQTPGRRRGRLTSLRMSAGLANRGQADSEDFRMRLQSVAGVLPQIEVSTERGSPHWNHVGLNAENTRLDAFRFRSPLDQPADMFLTFAVPGEEVSLWHILPAEGVMQGFESFQRESGMRSEALNLADDNSVVFQRLLGGRIQPDQEYILWFYSGPREPREMYLAVTLLPAGSEPDAASSQAIAEVIGADLAHPQFAATEDGVQQALQHAFFLWKRDAAEGAAFAQALQSVASALPEISPAADDSASWHEIQLSGAPGIHALRYSPNVAEPAELQLLLSTPRGCQADCRVLTGDGALAQLESSFEVDLKLDGVQLPPENVTELKTYPGGQVQPGRDYVVCVVVSDAAEGTCTLGMRTSPPNAALTAPSSQQVVERLGLQWPQTVEPSRIRGTLEMCHVWCRDLKGNGRKINRAVQSIASAAPRLEATTDRRNVVWNHVALDAGVGFDAVLLPADPQGPTTRYIAFADVNGMQFGFVPSRGSLEMDFTGNRDTDLRIQGIELPRKNIVEFRVMPVPAGEDHLLWFNAIDPSQSKEVAVAFLHGSPDSGRESPYSSYTTRGVSRAIGVRWQLDGQPTTSLLVAEHGDAVADVCFSPRGGLAWLGRDGVVKLWNPKTKQVVGELTADEPGRGRSMDISPDGRLLAVSFDSSPAVDLWDLTTRQRIGRITTEGSAAGDVAFSPDGKTLFFYSYTEPEGALQTGYVAVWDVEKRDGRGGFELTGPRIATLAVAPDGDIVTAGLQVQPVGDGKRLAFIGKMMIFESESLDTLHEMNQPGAWYTDLAICPATGVAAAAGYQDVVKLWHLQEERDLPPLKSLRVVNSVAFSPDGSQLACGCQDATLQLWDLSSRRLLFAGHAHNDTIDRVAFSPDGRWIASASRDTTVRLWDTRFPESQAVTNSIGAKLIRIPAGHFVMGTPDSFRETSGYGRTDTSFERPQHPVTMTKDFLIGMHEITVQQFRQFVEATGYKTTAESGKGGSHMTDLSRGFETRPELTWQNPGFPQEDDHPVVQVSWLDAVAFCQWLSEKEDAVYRLPTEAEWEYVCRAGSTSIWSYADNAWHLSHSDNVADDAIRSEFGQYGTATPWNDGHAFTSPVGSFAPNAFGVYDMQGNVFEWCADWYDPKYYSYSPPEDPQGPSSGRKRVQRGGSCMYHVNHSRCSSRDFDDPDRAQSCAGFRIVKEID